MKAIGLIETRGLLPAIECADVMLKTAQVEFLNRTFVGSGLVTITVTGDVGAVKAAVEAGVTAVVKINPGALVSQHVIPRPHTEINIMVVPQQENVSLLPDSEPTGNPDDPLTNREMSAEYMEPAGAPREIANQRQIMPELFRKEGVDALVQELGLEESVEVLKSLSVAKLRNLARDYKGLGLAGRAISKANKDLLLEKLADYYQRGSNK